jgi:hypothetical protein
MADFLILFIKLALDSYRKVSKNFTKLNSIVRLFSASKLALSFSIFSLGPV